MYGTPISHARFSKRPSSRPTTTAPTSGPTSIGRHICRPYGRRAAVARFTNVRSLRYTSLTMPTSDLAKILIAVGIVALIAGVLLLLWPHIPLLGHLPGDFSFSKGNTRVFIPIATSIVISLILTVVINVVLRLFR